MTPLQNARKLLAGALAVPEQALAGDVRIGSLDQWDSLAHARILLALEETLGKPLDAAEAAAIESLADIAAALARHS